MSNHRNPFQRTEEAGPHNFNLADTLENFHLIVYNWVVDEAIAETWRAGTFRDVPYTYRTFPLSAIATLDDVVPKVVEPLLAHDLACRAV